MKGKSSETVYETNIRINAAKMHFFLCDGKFLGSICSYMISASYIIDSFMFQIDDLS